ncbi:MAG TPA: hypothetical protein VE442_03900, partial [Jatrophihabitans sp.]|nr:hypothetical protein [Jatrophihabitans sp.]
MAGELKQRAQRVLPTNLVQWLDRLVFVLRRARIRTVHRIFAALGVNIVKWRDYYSPLPVISDLDRNRARWDRPSELPGIDVAIEPMQERLAALADRWETDYLERAG